MNAFEGTADYYNQYRPSIPTAAITTILRAASVGRPINLLDLGTGTGQVLEPFLPYTNHITVVEPDGKMLAHAKNRLGHNNITYIQANAETALNNIATEPNIVTIAHAFHWMNQEQVLKKLHNVVSPLGALAILGDSAGFWTTREEKWQTTTRHVIQQFLGARRRIGAGYGQGSPYPQHFPELVQASPFSEVRTYAIPHIRRWTVQTLIGYLYSTSYANRKHFGDDAPEFEQALTNALPTGNLIEHNELQVLIARRPTTST